MVDLCIRNARLRHKGDELFDIAITDGRIADIGKKLGVLARDEIDAEGSLVTDRSPTRIYTCAKFGPSR